MLSVLLKFKFQSQSIIHQLNSAVINFALIRSLATTMDSNKIEIRRATSDDKKEILQGLKDWYWPYEPLSIGFEIKTPSPTEEKIFPGIADKDMSVVATIAETNKIVGFLLNAPNHPKLGEELAQKIKGSSCRRIEAMFNLMDTIEEQVDIFKKYNVEKCFQLVCITVDPEMRGQSIGAKLFQYSFELGKSLGFTVAVVDCSSIYSTRIAESLGMERIASIEYKNYKDSNGKQIFCPPSEHTHMTRFAINL